MRDRKQKDWSFLLSPPPRTYVLNDKYNILYGHTIEQTKVHVDRNEYNTQLVAQHA